MRKREPAVLYFTAGTAVTPEDQIAMDLIGGNIKVRNGQVDVPRPPTALEACVAVAGHVPPRYAAEYPVVMNAADLFAILHPETDTRGSAVAEEADPASETPAAPAAPAGEAPIAPAAAPKPRGRPAAKKAAAKKAPAPSPTWTKNV